MNEYFKAVIRAAESCGPIFKKYFGRATGKKYKDNLPRNLVTDADLQIEKKLRSFISKNYPNDLILGEEFGGKATLPTGKKIWIIDPVDGTNNFAQGIPLCCISVAVWDFKGPYVAAIFNPITGEMFSGCRSQGAFLNGKKISVSKTRKPEDSYGGFGWSSRTPKKKRVRTFLTATECFGKSRALGTAALALSYVATGRFDFFLAENLGIWDMAAGALLITEAGGKISASKGKPFSIHSTGIVATNGYLQKYAAGL